VGERLIVLLPEAELVLDGLSELLGDAELLGLVLMVCEDVGLAEDENEALDVGTAEADEDELADELGVPVGEDDNEPLWVMVDDDDAEGVKVPVAVGEALIEELEDDVPLGV